MDIIQINELHFAYPGENREALQGVNLTLEEGRFYILCGQSGCGKSTLLRYMKAALAPKGRVYGSISKSVPEEEIGFVFQNPDNQIVTDRVWHELVFGMESRGSDQDTMNLRVAEIAAYFGIEQWFDRDVSELSGGQKQLLNLAAVMTLRPKLLLLDEPMAWLDPMAASEFLHMLYRIQREMGMTVLLSAHQLEEVISYGDELLLMREGEIASQGSPADIGRELRRRGDEFYYAMPAPLRICLELGMDGDCPYTIAGGRKWLRREMAQRQVQRDRSGSDISCEKDFSEDMADELRDSFGAEKRDGKIFSSDITDEQKGSLTSERERQPVLIAKNLCFRYPQGDTDILRGTSLEVHRGEILGILGGNGSGKSTLLRALSGILSPGRGRVRIDAGGQWIPSKQGVAEGRVVMLPQDVTSVFTEETVGRELAGDKMERDRLAEAFGLSSLMERHPFDISGGQQQKVALVKLLLRGADIFLLDEPTKGMDATDKRWLGKILEELARRGKTVLMVSHDLEFTAAYTHRTGLFFRGKLEGMMPVRDFFCQNHFYTTAAHRMSSEFIPWAVTVEDVLEVLSGATDSEGRQRFLCQQRTGADRSGTSAYEKSAEQDFSVDSPCRQDGMPYREMTEVTPRQQEPSDNTGGRDMKWFIAGIFILYPVLLWLGSTFLHDRRYLLISVGMAIYALLPFFGFWEGRKPKVHKLVVLSVLSAVAVAGRCAFYMLPGIKPMAAVAITAGVSLGAESGFFVGAMSMLVSNMMFGQGPWTPWQMLAMGLVGLFAGILMHRGSFLRTRPFTQCVCMMLYGMASVLCVYGGIMNPASLLMGAYEVNAHNLLAVYLSGLPLDLVHAVSTALILLAAGVPMLKKLERMKKKYELS